MREMEKIFSFSMFSVRWWSEVKAHEAVDRQVGEYACSLSLSVSLTLSQYCS